jgi:predicted ATP-binding protein involved in virulence
MIFVDRSSTPPPDKWRARAQSALRRAREFYSIPHAERAQRRRPFDSKPLSDAKPHLAKIFHRKCAYCESPISPIEVGDIGFFRPRAEATGLLSVPGSGADLPRSTRSDPDAYWWLAYEWDNLRLVCSVCERNKRNRFPVAATRAQAEARGAELLTERAVLIDPCADRPEQYLVFDEAGLVRGQVPDSEAARAAFPDIDRGAVTIDIIGLNRPRLVSARYEHLQNMRKLWTSWLRAGAPIDRLIDKIVPATCADDRPYAGIKRQFMSQWLNERVANLSVEERSRLAWLLGTYPLHKAFQSITGVAAQVAPGKLTAESAAKRPPRRTKAAIDSDPIESIRIVGFRAIDDLTLTFRSESKRAAWLVLLGENGTGKSSALQAVALALMGPRYVAAYLREFRLRPADLLRRIGDTRTVAAARVTIAFRNGRTIEMSVDAKRVRFPQRPPTTLFVRAFGSTRLLPRRNARQPADQPGSPKRVANLFDPSRAVLNANAWLTKLKGERFDSAALSIKDLLALSDDSVLDVSARRVRVPLHGALHPLDDLSAGYESVLATVCEIVAGVLGSVHDLRYATGIVLLDEIDAHLHPRWKMRIVGRLRATFPAMQFIVTTHEPLCLRGAEDNEVVLFQRDENGEPSYVADLPSPKDLRVDQLLTSELFGLYTAIDPTRDAQFQEYYRLLARENELNATERARLADLRKDLPPSQIVHLLGDNRREQLIYEAVDQYLAKTLVHRDAEQAAGMREELQNAREDVKRRIAAIWTGTATAS